MISLAVEAQDQWASDGQTELL